MEVVRSIESWRKIRSSIPDSKSIGYVATMGNLHIGHQSLFLQSKDENDISIASIFVNPTQFNEKADYNSYPRTEKEDSEILEACGVNYVLFPLEEEIYHDKYFFKIHTSHPVSQIMEGVFRPEHFDGMLTVVLKFLLLVKPTNAYFGEKDYQQFLLIQEMADALFLEVNIIGCETVRSETGLALSSRNSKLTEVQKLSAEKINTILCSGKSIDEIKSSLIALGLNVEYVEQYMQRIFAAVRIGNARIIDNILIKQQFPLNK